MRHTSVPYDNNDNKDEKLISQLEKEINTLRFNTQQEIKRSSEDAERIRDEIYQELVEKRNMFSEEIRAIISDSEDDVDEGKIKEIMNLINSDNFNNVNGKSSNPLNLHRISTIFSSLSAPRNQPNESNFNSCCFVDPESYSIPDSDSNNISMRPIKGRQKRRKSIQSILGKSGEVYHNFADKILRPRKEKNNSERLLQMVDEFNQQIEDGSNVTYYQVGENKTRKLFSIKYNCKTLINDNHDSDSNKESTNGELDLLERLYTEEREKNRQIKQAKEKLKKELLNEITLFERMNEIMTSELRKVLEEEEDIMEDLELKVNFQQAYIKQIQEEIDNSKKVLEDTSMQVDFPKVEDRFESNGEIDEFFKTIK